MNKTTLENIKKSVVFIGSFYKSRDGELLKSKLFGTGFLANINSQLYLITAKHVVCDLDEEGNVINEKRGLDFFTKAKAKPNTKAITTGQLGAMGTPIDDFCYASSSQSHWYFHEYPYVDLAITRIKNNKNDNISLDIVPYNSINFTPSNSLLEADDVFYISFQPGISDIENDVDVAPIFRKGSIARINPDKTLFIDGFTFFGNSGSPVFITKTIGRKTTKKFIGIIGTELTHTTSQFDPQSGQVVIINQENTGLSHTWSVDYIYEIIDSIKLLGKSNNKLLKS